MTSLNFKVGKVQSMSQLPYFAGKESIIDSKNGTNHFHVCGGPRCAVRGPLFRRYMPRRRDCSRQSQKLTRSKSPESSDIVSI